MRIAGRAITYTALWLGSFLYSIPLVWMLLTSFTQNDAIPEAPPRLWPDPWTWQNYIDMWETVPLASWVTNSLILVALGLLGQTFVSIFVAFGFA